MNIAQLATEIAERHPKGINAIRVTGDAAARPATRSLATVS